MNWLSLMASNWKLILTGACALALLAVSAIAMYYRSRCETLTAQISADKQVAEKQAESVEALYKREKSEYEHRIEELQARIVSLNSALGGVRERADALQKRLDTASAEACRRASEKLIDDIERGAAVAAKCADELGRKSEALTTCVRMYEDVKSVYDPAD